MDSARSEQSARRAKRCLFKEDMQPSLARSRRLAVARPLKWQSNSFFCGTWNALFARLSCLTQGIPTSPSQSTSVLVAAAAGVKGTNDQHAQMRSGRNILQKAEEE